MPETSYKRELLIDSLFTVIEGESMTFMVGTMAGRHGDGALSESSHLIYKQEAEKVRLGLQDHQWHTFSNTARPLNPS